MHADTIVATATPPGRGGVGIVRLSGPRAAQIAASIAGALPPPRRVALARFRDADQRPIDAGLVLYFSAPHSYTGEEVVELHGHGGAVVVETLVSRAVELGARRARGGEFTERAFLNGKLDLAQAEALADLIDSGSREAARAAMRSLEGEFSTRIHEIVEGIIELRTHVEAAIDFVEEEIDFLADPQIAQRLASIRAQLQAVQRNARQGRVLTEGMTVAIAGPPNAGKSSLLNRLAGYEAAIVTALPGTTRDVLRERIAIDGMPVHLCDTAGLRCAGDDIEAEGIRRARAQITRADRVLFVVDAAADPKARTYEAQSADLPADVPVTLVLNKCDLNGDPALADPSANPPRLLVSAVTGAGLDTLRAHLKACMGYHTLEAGTVSARQRHLDALALALRHIEAAALRLAEDRAGELVAQELRDAQTALGAITGEFTTEALLGRIFSSFCVGK